jgi:hypothetical protein
MYSVCRFFNTPAAPSGTCKSKGKGKKKKESTTRKKRKERKEKTIGTLPHIFFKSPHCPLPVPSQLR